MSERASPVVARVSTRALEEFVRAALAGPRAGLVLVTVPAPVAVPETLWRAAPSGPAVLWDPPGGPALAGIGAAAVVRLAGPDRFTQLATAAPAIWRGLRVERHSEAPEVEPALLGGLAFASAAADGAWAGFDDGWFMVPRWTYACTAAGAGLTLALGPGEELADVPLLGQIVELLARPPAPPAAPSGVVVDDDADGFCAAVEGARAAIRAGALEKVVLVHRLRARLAAAADPSTVLAALACAPDALYRFGFRCGTRSFIGASPELLVARRGRRVTSEALAGSAARASAPQRDAELAEELLRDPKQRDEHRIVVEAVAAALEPCCSALEAPARPHVRRLRDLQHLRTPFTGTLGAPVSLAALADRLHPTPAVGGAPTAAALEWIGRHEAVPRGWFAGPVGRLAAGGDGELAVALRCALLEGDHAHVFAGAGIVAASEPATELAEVRTKARACLAALGLGE